jgi:hypothetical protein
MRAEGGNRRAIAFAIGGSSPGTGEADSRNASG